MVVREIDRGGVGVIEYNLNLILLLTANHACVHVNAHQVKVNQEWTGI